LVVPHLVRGILKVDKLLLLLQRAFLLVRLFRKYFQTHAVGDISLTDRTVTLAPFSTYATTIGK
jgi:hypothetical protein